MFFLERSFGRQSFALPYFYIWLADIYFIMLYRDIWQSDIYCTMLYQGIWQADLLYQLTSQTGLDSLLNVATMIMATSQLARSDQRWQIGLLLVVKCLTTRHLHSQYARLSRLVREFLVRQTFSPVQPVSNLD